MRGTVAARRSGRHRDEALVLGERIGSVAGGRMGGVLVHDALQRAVALEQLHHLRRAVHARRVRIRRVQIGHGLVHRLRLGAEFHGVQQAELLAGNARQQILDALGRRQRHHGRHHALVGIGDGRQVIRLGIVPLAVVQAQVGQGIEIVIDHEYIDIAHIYQSFQAHLSDKVSEGSRGARHWRDREGEAYFGTRAFGIVPRTGAPRSRSVEQVRRSSDRRNVIQHLCRQLAGRVGRRREHLVGQRRELRRRHAREALAVAHEHARGLHFGERGVL